MSKRLFNKIQEGLKTYDAYFTQRRNAVGKLGLSTIQKCTAPHRILEYGASEDSLDDNLRMGESPFYNLLNALRQASLNCLELSIYARQTNKTATAY